MQAALDTSKQQADRARASVIEKYGNPAQRLPVSPPYAPSTVNIAALGKAAGIPLTADQREAIGDHVRECWTYDPGALSVDKMQVILQATVDESGVARTVIVTGGDEAKLNDPVFRAFADRARSAVLDPHCANLPLPPSLLGKPSAMIFRFSP
jgi:hypothetical protein